MKEELELQNMRERNEEESGFGVGKRRYGLGRIMAKLKETSESVIMLQFIVMNLNISLEFFFLGFQKDLENSCFPATDI